MADYIYNPAESIKQGFQQTQAGLGNIFTQIIQQQQRDYTLAESAFQNIEALKKDVNIFGQKNITAKSNELLKQAGSAILKDGKLDYSKLGEIRQGISDIKDLKAGYDVGAKEYERMLQLGIANKDNLVSFEKFYKDLSAKMADENLVKNPQDLQRAMADTYSNNLDSFKMYGKSYLGANPYQKIAQDVKDPKTGALMRVQAELPTGWTIDAQGNKVPPAPKTMVVNGQNVTMDYVDQELARLQSTNPDMLALMKKQAGFAGQTMSDRDLVKSFIDRIPTTTQATQVKNADELRGQKAQADLAEFKAKTAPQEFNMDMRIKKSQADYYDAKANEKATGATAPADYAQGNMYDIDVPLSSGKVAQLTAAPLGKNMKLSIGNTQAVVTDIAKSKKSGDIWAKVLVDEKGVLVLDDSKVAGAKQTWRKVTNPEVFKKTIDRTIHSGGFANKEKPYAQALVDGVFNAKTENLSSMKGTTPPAAPKPAAVKYQSGQIEGNTIYLDSSLKGREKDILNKYKVSRAVYIN
jgi:hypothetical protein